MKGDGVKGLAGHWVVFGVLRALALFGLAVLGEGGEVAGALCLSVLFVPSFACLVLDAFFTVRRRQGRPPGDDGDDGDRS